MDKLWLINSITHNTPEAKGKESPPLHRGGQVKKSRKDFLKSLVYATGAAAIPPLGSVRGDSIYDEPNAKVVAVDRYDFRVRLQVPQVLDNTDSQGYRTYKLQGISGQMFVNWLSDGKFSNI